MARHKPAWRRVLTGRRLRWIATLALVRMFPGMGRLLGVFPRGVDLVAAADRVLVDEHLLLPATDLGNDRVFLDQCLPNDSTDPAIDLDRGIDTGARTGLFSTAWIDMVTGSILLPAAGATVQMRSAGVNWNTCSTGWRRKQVPIQGLVFAPQTTVQYFHLLTENGLRLIDLLERRVLDGPLTVVKPPDRTSVEAAMYAGIATLYPDVEVQQVPGRVMVQPEQAVGHFPRGDHWEWPPVTPVLARQLAAAFQASYPELPSQEGEGLLYLSRQSAKLRRVRNGDDLERALQMSGYKVLEASDTNHPEQIARFASARIVVAVHGAGLTNLLFCRPGTHVVEIFPANFVKSPYWWICRQLGLNHIPVIGGPGDYDQHFDVDVDAVVAALDRAHAAA